MIYCVRKVGGKEKRCTKVSSYRTHCRRCTSRAKRNGGCFDEGSTKCEEATISTKKPSSRERNKRMYNVFSRANECFLQSTLSRELSRRRTN